MRDGERERERERLKPTCYTHRNTHTHKHTHTHTHAWFVLFTAHSCFIIAGCPHNLVLQQYNPTCWAGTGIIWSYYNDTHTLTHAHPHIHSHTYIHTHKHSFLTGFSLREMTLELIVMATAKDIMVWPQQVLVLDGWMDG